MWNELVFKFYFENLKEVFLFVLIFDILMFFLNSKFVLLFLWLDWLWCKNLCVWGGINFSFVVVLLVVSYVLVKVNRLVFDV